MARRPTSRARSAAKARVRNYFVATGGITLPTPPIFTTLPTITTDGTPQVGEQLVGSPGVVTGGTIVSRRWLLGSTVLATVDAYTATGAGRYEYLVRAEGPGGVTERSAFVDVAAVVTPPPAPYQLGPLLTNLTQVYDSEGAQYFLDYAKTARVVDGGFNGFSWKFANGAGDAVAANATHYTPEGWPAILPPGAEQASAIIQCFWNAENIPNRKLVILSEGGQTFDFGQGVRLVSTTPGRTVIEITPDLRPDEYTDVGFFTLIMRNISASKPVIKIVREDQEALLAAGEIFAPDFLNILEQFGGVRFMDWQRTNNSGLSAWADRPLPSDASWAGTKGVPLEVMIALANKAKQHPWFCIPHLATDDFVTRMVGKIITDLDPKLIAQYEYANEIWNDQFQQTLWLRQEGDKYFSGLGTDYHEHEMAGYKSALHAKLIKQVYASAGLARSRFRNIMGLWTTALGRMAQRITGATWAGGNGLPATGIAKLSDVFDDGAGTGYFAGGMTQYRNNQNDLAKMAQWANSNDYNSLLTQLYQGGLLEDSQDNDFVATVSLTAQMVDWCNEHGLTPIFYEEGVHVVPPVLLSGPDKKQFIKAMAAALETPRGGAIYKEAKETYAKVGVVRQCNFVLAQQPTEHGFWGSTRFLDSSPPAPRLQALLDYQANPVPKFTLPVLSMANGYRYMRLEVYETPFSGPIAVKGQPCKATEFEFLAGGQRLEVGPVRLARILGQEYFAGRAVDGDKINSFETVAGNGAGQGEKMVWYLDLFSGRIRPEQLRIYTLTDDARYFAPLQFALFFTNDPAEFKTLGAGRRVVNKTTLAQAKAAPGSASEPFCGIPADGSGLIYSLEY